MSLKRFGVSLEKDYLEELDNMVEKKQFPNRSQAIRFLIKQCMVKDQWSEDKDVAGAIVMIYDHHKKELLNKSTAIQHNFHKVILSSQHVHLDHNNCIETIIVKGKSSVLQTLADRLLALKGVTHGELVMTGGI